MLLALTSSQYVVLQTEETIDNPTGFKEGLPQYVTLSDGDDFSNLGQFLLCTSCTISYMFGTPRTSVTPEQIVFREHPDQALEVVFETRTLEFTKAAVLNSNEKFKVTMEIGIIDQQYASGFNWPNQGVIGLAPSS